MKQSLSAAAVECAATAGGSVFLHDLKTPADYLSGASHLFPSLSALRWFMRAHRQQLLSARALLRINRRLLIHQHRFDQVVLEVGAAGVAKQQDGQY